VRWGLAAVVVGLVLVVAGCAGGDRPSREEGRAPSTTAATDVPPELAAFLQRAAAAEDAAFVARYEVLRKLGGVSSTIGVVAVPGSARITVGDLVLVAGDEPATCLVSVGACVEGLREERLARFGVFSRFWSTGPADALEAVTRRPDDGAPVLSSRQAAGVALECAAVPVGRSLPSTACITPEGVFGYVDNPSVRYELTAYRAGPPADEDVGAPFPVGRDDGFLAAPEAP
jgi:hypothetical protein